MTYTKAGGEQVEVVGTVDIANEVAVLLKLRGKTNGLVLTPDQIVDYGLDDSKPVELKQKELKDTTLNTVRAHLADRHGLTLEEVNGLDEEAAAELHLTLDHGKLSHTHPFISEAEAEADGEEPDEDEVDEDELDDDEDDDA
jgi:hypothetical protein